VAKPLAVAAMIGAVVGSFFHYMKTGPVEPKEDHPDADRDGRPDDVMVIEAPPSVRPGEPAPPLRETPPPPRA
jgi:formate dehydrogenase iron-sulfur subunit